MEKIEVTDAGWLLIWCKSCNRFYKVSLLNTGNNDEHYIKSCIFCESTNVELSNKEHK